MICSAAEGYLDRYSILAPNNISIESSVSEALAVSSMAGNVALSGQSGNMIRFTASIWGQGLHWLDLKKVNHVPTGFVQNLYMLSSSRIAFAATCSAVCMQGCFVNAPFAYLSCKNLSSVSLSAGLAALLHAE